MNGDLMAFAQPCKMTGSPQRIAGSMRRLLRKRYALKGDMFKSVVEIRIERSRNRLDTLELRRQTNVEILAMHAQDLVRKQYLD